jgi:predicted nucleotidyltransferase
MGQPSQKYTFFHLSLDESQHIGMKFFGMYEDLKALLGRNVDLVTDRSLASFARESVDRDKILIYERTA